MVNKTIKFLIVSSIFFSCISSSAREVQEIEIKESGIYDQGEEDFCEAFKPTKNQLILFFKVAKEAREYGTAFHEYDSPCLASGKVSFKDGTSGDWKLRSSGLATVFFNDGETSTFFFRGNKWKDPYACNYGSGDNPEC